MRPPTNNWR